jgi:hypothetical protein
MTRDGHFGASRFATIGYNRRAMKQRRPAGAKQPRLLTQTELAHVSAGAGDGTVEKLKQHVDNPGQTP